MGNLSQRFGFEKSVVRVGNGYFRPLTDAARRWVCQASFRYDSDGERFNVLYELRDGRFAYVAYNGCYRTTVKSYLFWRREIWIGIVPSQAELVPPNDAVKLLTRWQCVIPEHLDRFLAVEPPTADKPSPARKLEHWSGKGHLTRQARRQAHEVQPLDAVRELIEIAIPCILQVRVWSADAGKREYTWMSRGDDFCWQAFGALLFRRYPVDPNCWWGDTNDIPPASIGLHEFPWKPGETDLVDALRQLQCLLEPMLVVLYHSFPLTSSDIPSTAESQAAFEGVIAALPDFESKVRRLKSATAALQSKIEQLDDSALKGKTLNQPSDKAIAVYRLWFALGQKQEDIAKSFEVRYGHLMDQGTVSKYLKQVRAWVEAGNILPPEEQSTVKPKIHANSPAIDLGANITGRTPRQRGRKTKED